MATDLRLLEVNYATAPTDKQVPVYSSSTGKWAPTSLTATSITGLTIKQILYGNSAGNIGQESNLLWDYTNHYLGIGGTPAHPFHLQVAAYTLPVFSINDGYYQYNIGQGSSAYGGPNNSILSIYKQSFNVFFNTTGSSGAGYYFRSGGTDLFYHDSANLLNNAVGYMGSATNSGGLLLGQNGDWVSNNNEVQFRANSNKPFVWYAAATIGNLAASGTEQMRLNTTGILQVIQGAATTIPAKVGGTIFDHYVNSGNVGTGEDDIYSDTIPANALNTDGHKLTAIYSFQTASSTSTKQIRLRFAGTLVWDSTALSPAAVGYGRIEAHFVRTSSSSVRYSITGSITSAAGVLYYLVNTHGALTGLTLSGTNVLKLTGEAAGVGPATDDIIGVLSSVDWKPSA